MTLLAACGTPPPDHDPARTHYVFIGDLNGQPSAHGEYWRSDGNGLTMFCGSLRLFDPTQGDRFWKFGDTCTP